MIKKIIFAVLLGFVATVVFVQNHQWVHDRAAQKVAIILESIGNCTVEFKVQRVNLFSPSVTLEQVKAYPKSFNAQFSDAAPWSWESKTLTLSCSWFTLLFYGMVGLHVHLKDLQGQTIIEQGRIAVVEQHIRGMIEGPSDAPVFLKSLTFEKAHLVARYPDIHVAMDLDWSSESKNMNGIFKTNIHLHDGALTLYERTMISKLSGAAHLDISSHPTGLQTHLTFDGKTELEQLTMNKKTCFLNGAWNNGQGLFTLKSADQLFDADAIKVRYDNGIHLDAHARMPARYLLDVIDASLGSLPLDGSCEVALQGLFSADRFDLSGQSTSGPLTYNARALCDTSMIAFKKEDTILKGTLSAQHQLLGALEGSWQWDIPQSKGHCILSNAGAVSVPDFPLWSLAEHAMNVRFDLDEHRTITGSYRGIAQSALLDAQVELRGTLALKNDLLALVGHLNRNVYELALVLQPTLRLQRLSYKDSSGNALIDLTTDKDDHNNFQGPISFELLRLLVKQFLSYNLQGEGILNLKGSLADNLMHLKGQLAQGTIRLPETYNFIDGFDVDMTVDFDKKKVVAHHVHSTLHRGNATVERAVALFDDAYNLTYAYLPLMLDSCLLNLKKDLFAVVSGGMTMLYDAKAKSALTGRLIIDRSQLKENIFSDALQKSVLAFTSGMFEAKGFDMACDVTIETRNPIRVDTAFFQAQAKATVHVGNTVIDPKVSGSVEILSGTLAFPYKPLTITKGHIYLLPDQINDPIIELVAKNKIKKFNVSLHVNGSLLNHDIALESTPSLTEEQIIALLLVGSQEESLSIVMPALVMQNLKTVFFDSEQSPSRLNSFFQSWLKPLSNIHLVPSFSDQTGRGGLRGAVEIDINDRLRAVAQQNFSLSEDTRFEVEYLLSDDVSIRGIRNERRDVGGEVEMRWKFGS
ncbi:MAG: translocation/assembly module TamB domain-containing protein [Candidatus Dependentiae bacterium]|nr:translocation/assembly module TamB domain-containing protein [Candidatus Dependentiae bacterium]